MGWPLVTNKRNKGAASEFPFKKKKKKRIFGRGRACRRAGANFSCEAGWWCVRGDREREIGGHVSELFTRISGTCVRRGAELMASGQRGGPRRKQKMMSGWQEVVEKLGMVMQMNLFIDGHTASNAPDLF